MIFKFLKIFSIIFIGLYISGCAQTELGYVKNPEFNQTKFKKILIFANISDLNLAKKTELNFIDEFKSLGINSVSSLNIIPPVKEYNKDELLDIFNQNGIDGILIITLKDVKKDSIYVPPQEQNQQIQIYSRGNFQNYSYTEKYGGFFVTKTSLKFDTVLIDAKTEKIVWRSTADVKDIYLASYDTMVESMAKKIGKSLIKENIVESKK